MVKQKESTNNKDKKQTPICGSRTLSGQTNIVAVLLTVQLLFTGLFPPQPSNFSQDGV